jgi:photosystem II stability/assembly factor-like uncharacterized protein
MNLLRKLILLFPVSKAIVYSKCIFCGGTGGVWRSTDNGVNWTKVLATGATDVKNLRLISGIIYACSYEKIYSSSDYGVTWITLSSGLPSACYIYDIILIGTRLLASVVDNRIVYKSDNGGLTWSQSSTGISATAGHCLMTHDSSVFIGVEGNANGIYRSDDNGANWSVKDTGTDNIYCYSFFADGDNLYAGTEESGVFLSVDNGENWTKISTGIPASGGSPVRSIVVNGTDIFVGISLNTIGIYKTTDGGTNWTQKLNGVTVFNVTLIINDDLDKFIFVGRTNKILRSIDNGESFPESYTGFSSTLSACYLYVS